VVAHVRSLMISSWRDIEVLRFSYDFITKVRAEKAGGVKINRTAEKRRQFALKGEESQSNARIRLEFDQDIKVAVGPEVVAERRAEDGQSADVIPAAEIGQGIARNVERRRAPGLLVHERSIADTGRGFYYSPSTRNRVSRKKLDF
jgi:hypothetical protein